MTATTSEPIHLGSARSVTPGETPRIAGRGARLDASLPRPSWRWRAALMDGVELLALVWCIPLAMLLVGTPIALAIVLLGWLGRFALSAFWMWQILIGALAVGVLTTVLIVKLGYRSGFQAADLGSMSHEWVAAYNASRESSL